MADAKAQNQAIQSQPQAQTQPAPSQVGPQAIAPVADAPLTAHPPVTDTRQQQIPVPTNIYGRDGRLTHAGMKQAIANGGSVIANGKHINNVAELPTSADLAQTDEEKAAARAQLEAEHARISAQLAQLGDKPKK